MTERVRVSAEERLGAADLLDLAVPAYDQGERMPGVDHAQPEPTAGGGLEDGLLGRQRAVAMEPLEDRLAMAGNVVAVLTEGRLTILGDDTANGVNIVYDVATGNFTPEGEGAACGAACHTIVKAKDYVFTAYPKR